MPSLNYDLEVFYSPEDGGYIADCKGLPHCSAFGKTREAAMAEIEVAIQGWLAADKDRKERK